MTPHATLFGCFMASAIASLCLASSSGWEFAGPSTYKTRGDEDAPSLSSAGAVQDAVQGANGTWFIGSTNGGVWRTQDLRAPKPQWQNVLDGQPVTCASISALHVSTFDPMRVYAGCGGSTSSEEGSDWNVMNSGDWSGVMASYDGGDTWKMLPSFPENYYVTAILETDEKGSILVAAQSNLFNRDDGGIWMLSGVGRDGVQPARVSDSPTFTLTQLSSDASKNFEVEGTILATHARDSKRSVSISADGGATWSDGGTLPWAHEAAPFYTCAAEMADGKLVVAGLTRLSPFPNATSSQFFVKTATGWKQMWQPTSMDEDAMPKDRMAILGDPLEADTMYVAGNAGALAWRVNVSSMVWTKMWDHPDVSDGSIPHGDCRNYAWEEGGQEESDRLVLVSDGGIFARVSPRKPGGVWVSLNGNYASMELLSAHYDNRGGRFVAGAQDNCAQVTGLNAKPEDVATGFVEGDGTRTCVDNVANPARLFGTTQFLGVGAIDIDPSASMESGGNDDKNKYGDDGDDDDDDCGGLCFAQGDKFIGVPLAKYFPSPSSFPYFVTPYTLNTQDTTQLIFWANGSYTDTNNMTDKAYSRSGFYAFSLPHDGSIDSGDDISPPTVIQYTSESTKVILDFVAGGYTAGKSDPTLIVAVTQTQLLVRSSNTGGKMISTDLPIEFAAPVPMQYDPETGARILGPVTHGPTVAITVSPADSQIIAVTGWTSVATNNGPESIWITTDGHSWQNITANLQDASGVVGKVRPGGLLIVDLLENHARAVLVGCSNGVLVAYLEGTSEPGSDHFEFDPEQVHWSRFGSQKEFPLVLTAKISHEPYSDTLVAATFGRGIYTIKNRAKEALLDHRDSLNVSGTRRKRKEERSSAAYFPKQM